jgi:hypothetical protein
MSRSVLVDDNAAATDDRRAYGQLVVAVVVCFELVDSFSGCVDFAKKKGLF